MTKIWRCFLASLLQAGTGGLLESPGLSVSTARLPATTAGARAIPGDIMGFLNELKRELKT